MILAMKYINLIDNFVIVAKFDEFRCSRINRYGFLGKLCTLINPNILIN